MNNQIEIDALKNIFEDKSVKTVYGRITERISSRKFRIEDDIDRSLIVNSDREWGLGAYVIVRNNFIIGSGKPAGSFKVYSV